jgi:two-component system, NarL family, response regulator LiaR
MPKRILLVDDNRIVWKTTRGVFESAGFVYDEAEDGAKAVEKAPVFHPDLIVLDLAMPTMNGLQAAPLLRQILPSVPIILFTLYAGSVWERQAREAGITSVVAKDEAASKLLTQAKTLVYT